MHRCFFPILFPTRYCLGSAPVPSLGTQRSYSFSEVQQLVILFIQSPLSQRLCYRFSDLSLSFFFSPSLLRVIRLDISSFLILFPYNRLSSRGTLSSYDLLGAFMFVYHQAMSSLAQGFEGKEREFVCALLPRNFAHCW